MNTTNAEEESCEKCYQQVKCSCIKKKVRPKVKKRICACGRFRIGLFCTCKDTNQTIGADGLCTLCKNKVSKNLWIIDCKDFHPSFSSEEIIDHERNCYSCLRHKTGGERCLQKEWNLKNPTARNLSAELSDEYKNYVCDV